MKQGQLTEIINESLKLNESVDTGMEYWYYTKHGIGPGAIPKGVTVLDTVETDDWGTYVLLDKMLTTKELEDYEIKEQVPSEDEMNKARNSANKSLTEDFDFPISWDDLSGSDQMAVEFAEADIKKGVDIKTAALEACYRVSEGNAEPEYEDEDFYTEEPDYKKVIMFLQQEYGE